ncbi:hypothetical protein PS1_009240 [Malus domestica]
MSLELDEVAFDAGLIGPGGVVAKSVENVVLKVHDEEEDGESKTANTRNMVLDGVFIKKYPPIKLPKDSTSNCCHECIRLEASHIFLLAIL